MVSGAVDIVDVSHGYRQRGRALPVLDHVSISARPGEFVALVGPSGCGKSTLLRLLAGLESPLFGTVYVDGSTIPGPSPERALVFQDPTLLPWRTVRQNVEIGPKARGVLADSAERIEDTLNLVGLGEFAESLPAQLSGGMAQRAALARALVNDPKVFLLDEPLGKLDALTRRTLQTELLKLWQQRGFTALLVTHDVDEAIALADRIVVFSPRPASVVDDLAVDRPRPRLPDDPSSTTLRRHILSILDRSEGSHRRAI